MGRFGVTLAVATLSLAAWSAAAGETPTRDAAVFSYERGFVVAGQARGACDAAALDVSKTERRSLLVDGASAVLHVYTTFVNVTQVAPESGHPVEVSSSVEQVERDEAVALPAQVAWAADGESVLLERAAVLSGHEGFSVAFDSRGLEAEPAAAEVPTVQFWDARDGEPSWSLAGATRARQVHAATGDLGAEGDVAIFLRDATAGGYETGPSVERRESVEPGLVQRNEIHHHAVLDVTGASIAPPASGSRLVCRGADEDIEGTLTAYGATGDLTRGERRLGFSGRELRLEGRFTMRDEPQADASDRVVLARAAGEFTAAGIDFVPVPAAYWSTATGATLVGAAVLAGGLAFWKLLALLFTRLKPDSLLDREGRRRVHDAVQANPGITLADVAATAETSESNARYHLSVLRRHGRIRSCKVHGTWRYALVGVDPDRVKQRSLVEADPFLRRVLDLLSVGPVSAGSLIETLQSEAGLSRSGAWKVLDRAHSARLIVKERQGKRVILRSA